MGQREVIAQALVAQYTRNDIRSPAALPACAATATSSRGALETAIRIELFDDEVEMLQLFDPLTGKVRAKIPRGSPSNPAPAGDDGAAIERHQGQNCAERLDEFCGRGQAGRPSASSSAPVRPRDDAETATARASRTTSRMSAPSGRSAADAVDYLPPGCADVRRRIATSPSRRSAACTTATARARTWSNMASGCPRAGQPAAEVRRVRAPDAADDLRVRHARDYEKDPRRRVVEQVVRPTGLSIRWSRCARSRSQVDDLLRRSASARDRRTVLVTTLTKRMAERTDYLDENGVKVRYLHSDIDTVVERVEIIRDLRLGAFDVLVASTCCAKA